MIKILFVCLGNICRSPLAEGHFIELIKTHNLDKNVICDSAGTSSYHIGDLPDHRTRKNAENHGMILTHKARQFKAEDFDDFDYILVMDNSNLSNISIFKSNMKEYKAKVFKMRYFDYNFKDIDVPDPYYMGEEGFEEVYNILERSTSNFMSFLKAEHNL